MSASQVVDGPDGNYFMHPKSALPTDMG